MVTGFRHRDDRNVTSTQLADVFGRFRGEELAHTAVHDGLPARCLHQTLAHGEPFVRSEEHTSELQSLMRISYAVFCLKKKNNRIPQLPSDSPHHNTTNHT